MDIEDQPGLMSNPLLSMLFPAKTPTVAKDWSINTRTNPSITNIHGLSNAISTVKYSLISWLPKSVFEQFRRIANCYFLLISILMLIGTYATYLFESPLNPYSTVSTLVFVLLVTSIKEGIEDRTRHISDYEDNTRKVTVVTFDDSGKEILTEIESRNVKAGDIIKLVGRTIIPADMLLIMTSTHQDANQCFVETANIDGETNLKVKEAPPGLKSLLNNGTPNLKLFTSKVEYEAPHKDFYVFVGALHNPSLPDPLPLGIENLLVRSSVFCNTDWAYAIALYTGQESKIQLNSLNAPTKMSKLEGLLNNAILIIFAAQVLLVSISVISIYLMGCQDREGMWYVYPINGDQGSGSEPFYINGDTGVSILPLWLEQWFIFFLLYNNFIPISLYVSIELVNLGQGAFVSADVQIYDEDLDCACIVRSSNLCQELGMVSNVFSDKTGTLTKNEMNLVHFVVDGTTYDVPKAAANGQHPVMSHLNNTRPDVSKSKVYRFLRCLTTCHTVVREKDGLYRAESPDELALVQGVGVFGCSLKERGSVQMDVDLLGVHGTFEVLMVNAFNSDRKRMSLLIRDMKKNEYFIMCKGADNIMLPLCSIDSKERVMLDKKLGEFSTLALRTLCIAEKKLDEVYAKKMISDYKAAAASMEGRKAKMDAIAAMLEVNMDLLGITAVEDKLQDEVPEVIADLAAAGIVVWMLTGDKEETAISIGRSCNLILPDTKLQFLTGIKDSETYNNQLKTIYEDIQAHYIDGQYIDDGKVTQQTLVMDGESFKYFKAEDPLHQQQRKYLLAIGKACRSVIGCRLIPLQKQLVVNLVKVDTVPQAITLSIGDGANDVSMIREGNVGVGIFGKEGRQAANNSDFAIGQFKFLRRLLLVHGRWNYMRQARVFLYCMHKNMVLTLTLFWFSYFTYVSGTSIYESWIYTSYNFLLGLPIIFYGIMDRDLSDKFVVTNPQVYSTGKENTYLTTFHLATWILNAIVYAIVICLLYYYMMYDTFITEGVYVFGTTVFTGLVFALTLKCMFLHHQWDGLRAFLVVLSLAGAFIWYVIISESTYDYLYTSSYMYRQGYFWLFGVFFVPLVIILIDVLQYYIQYFFFPTKEMLFREVENSVEYKDDFIRKLSKTLGLTRDTDVSAATSSASASLPPPGSKPPGGKWAIELS